MKFAQSFEIAPDGGVFVDGKPFPWHVHKEAITIDVDPETRWSIVYLPVIVDGAVYANMSSDHNGKTRIEYVDGIGDG